MGSNQDKKLKMPWYHMTNSKNNTTKLGLTNKVEPVDEPDQDSILPPPISSMEELQKQYRSLHKDFVSLREKYETTKHELNHVFWDVIPETSKDFEILKGIEVISSKDGKTFKDYIIGSKIGDGKSSTVHLCAKQGESKLLVAKIMEKTKIYHFRGLERLKNELIVGQLYEHPSIIKITDVYQTKNKILLLMEKSTTDLFDFSAIFEANPDETVLCMIMSQLIDGLSYCHRNNIAHRDIKSENVLVNLNEAMEFELVKLCDFGLSSIGNERNSSLHEFCGSPGFFAPEVMLDRQKGFNGYKADVWSLGCILLELVIGQSFFGEYWLSIYDRYLHEPEAFVEAIKKQLQLLEEHLKCSPECSNFLLSVLQFDPALRPTCEELKSHPWIQKPKNLGILKEGRLDQSIVDEVMLNQHVGHEMYENRSSFSPKLFGSPSQSTLKVGHARRPRLTQQNMQEEETNDAFKYMKDISAEVNEELSNLYEILFDMTSVNNSIQTKSKDSKQIISAEKFLKGRNSILLVQQKISDNIREQMKRSNILVERLLSMAMNSMKHTITEISEIGTEITDELKRYVDDSDDSNQKNQSKNMFKTVKDLVDGQQNLCTVVATSSFEVVQAAKMEAGIFSANIIPIHIFSSIEKSVRMVQNKFSSYQKNLFTSFLTASDCPRKYIIYNDENFVVEYLVMLMSFAYFFVHECDIDLVCYTNPNEFDPSSSGSSEPKHPENQFVRLWLGISLKSSNLSQQAFDILKKITLSSVLEHNMSEGTTEERLAHIFFIRADMCAKIIQQTALQSQKSYQITTPPNELSNETNSTVISSNESEVISDIHKDSITTKSELLKPKKVKQLRGLQFCTNEGNGLVKKDSCCLYIELQAIRNVNEGVEKSFDEKNCPFSQPLQRYPFQRDHKVNHETDDNLTPNDHVHHSLSGQWKLNFKGHMRILVADDSKAMRQMMVMLFQRLATQYQGFVAEVYTAWSAEEALRMTEKMKFHIILMDEHFSTNFVNGNSNTITEIKSSQSQNGEHDSSGSMLSIVLNGDKIMDAHAKKAYFDTEQQGRQIFIGDGTMSGSEAIRFIRNAELSKKISSPSSLPRPNDKSIIITCTGQDECSDMSDYLDAGANAILSKPYRNQDFVRIMERMIPDLISSNCVTLSDYTIVENRAIANPSDVDHVRVHLWGKLLIASKHHTK